MTNHFVTSFESQLRLTLRQSQEDNQIEVCVQAHSDYSHDKQPKVIGYFKKDSSYNSDLTFVPTSKDVVIKDERIKESTT